MLYTREVLYFSFILFAINATQWFSYSLFNISGEKNKKAFYLTEHIKKTNRLQNLILKTGAVDKIFPFFPNQTNRAISHTWLIVGSLVRSIWNTGGGRVCCRTCSNCCGCPHTAMALVKWSTPFSYSPVWQIIMFWNQPSSTLQHISTKHPPRVDYITVNRYTLSSSPSLMDFLNTQS